MEKYYLWYKIEDERYGCKVLNPEPQYSRGGGWPINLLGGFPTEEEAVQRMNEIGIIDTWKYVLLAHWRKS